MAKILFIQHEATEKFGTMILSAVLKKEGHRVELFIELLEKESALDFIKEFQPNYVCFSITTLEGDWALGLAKKIKNKFNVKIIFGGAESTYNPKIIKNKSVDYLCRGEGENGLPELIRRLEKGKNLKGIENFWVKEKGRIIKNNLGHFIEDLDSLPVPDREIYYKYPLLKNLSTKKFLCSRGCPYNRTYCSNHSYHKLFAGMGPFIRFRSPKLVIKEVKEIKKEYGFNNVYFADETFTLNHPWLYKFLRIYKKEIGVPFSCLARANEIDKKTAKLLSECGCFYIAFGLESGSERIRNGILKRYMSNDVLLNAAKLLKKYHIPFLTHQMYVLPTETLEEAEKTVELNIKMGTDSVWDTVFQPFPNTEIYDFCKKKNLLPKKPKVDSMFGKSKIKNSDKAEIQKLRKLSWFSIKLPFLFPVVKRLVVRLPDNFIFNMILKISEVYSIRRRWRLSYFEMVRLAWQTGDKLG